MAAPPSSSSVGRPRRSANYASGGLGRLPRIHGHLRRFATIYGEIFGLGALACLWAAHALALDPSKAVTQYTHDNWQTESGLPQNSVSSVVQTPDGYLWLGTQEGLVRFDGVKFTVFDKWNTPAITKNHVRALCLDREGYLWAGTNGGGLLRTNGTEFEVWTSAKGLAQDKVFALCAGSDGSIWAGTNSGGLSRFKDGRFTNFTTRDGLSHDSILALCDDGEGGIWIGTNGGGLCRFSGGRFSTLDGKEGLPNPVVYALCRRRDGSLWVGTHGGGIGRLQGGRLETFTKKDGLPGDIVLSLFEDSDGSLWAGTFGNGLGRLAGGNWSTFTSGEGLAYDVVRAFYEDREKNLWVGMDAGGLSRLRDGSFTSFGIREGLSSDYALGIFEDREGRLWIGTNGGGVNEFRDSRLRAFTTAEGMPSNLIRCMFEDRSGVLWVGTDGGGIAHIREGRVTRFAPPSPLASGRVISLLKDRGGALWIGTYGGGLHCLRDGRMEHFTQKDGLAGDNVNFLYEDGGGGLWVGTYGGLSLFRDGRRVEFAGQNSFRGTIVASVRERPGGVLWFGTIGSGLIRLKAGRTKACTRRDGLFDDTAYSILEDGAGFLWMSGNKGVYKVRESDLEAFADGAAPSVASTSYGKADGMKSSECNGGFQPSACRTRAGILWFPTIRGAAAVDPSKIAINRTPPPVRIERVVVNDVLHEASGPLVLPPGPNRVEIHYAGLSFVAPQKVAFRYRLEGEERDWVDAGTRRVAYFTNIPAGRHEFRVIACNSDGIWNQEGASMRFEVRPRIYETPWFISLCVLLATFGAAGAHLVRVNRMEARQRELERLVGCRTEELRDANSRLEVLSSQDGLTGVANRRRFDEDLDTEFRRLTRSREPLSLIMVDIDHFKPYNDAYGHLLGDDCLVRVASALNGCLNRVGDRIARYGGEEFAVILSGSHAAAAAAMAETLRVTVQAMGIAHGHSSAAGVVTISLGVATTIPADAGTPSGLVDAADRALYRAKHEGRNRVCTAGSSPFSNTDGRG